MQSQQFQLISEIQRISSAYPETECYFDHHTVFQILKIKKRPMKERLLALSDNIP